MRKKQDEAKIYEAALQVFSEYGYKKATLEEIGNLLNMTNANLYGYSTSKLSLYYESVGYALKKWQNYVYEAIKDLDDPVIKLETMYDRAVGYLKEDKVFLKILKSDPEIFPLFPKVDPYEGINRRSVEIITGILQDGIEKGVFYDINTEKIAQISFSIYKNLIIGGLIQSDDSDVDEIYHVAKQMFVHGIVKD